MDTIDITTIDYAKISGEGIPGEWGHFMGPKAHEAAAFVHDQMKKWMDVTGKDVIVLTKYDRLIGLISAAKLVFDVRRVFTKPIPRSKRYKTK